MKIITLEDRVIYRADKGKKVHFENNDRFYNEIVVDLDDEREVGEVENGNL